MGKKILDSKVLYMVLSILVSFSFWCYVASTDGTPDSTDLRNVPVTFTGLDILEERGLMIVDPNVTTSVTVRAIPSVLTKLNNESVQIVANVSGISETGSHTVAWELKLPSGISSSQVDIVSGLRGNVVTINVDKFLRREVPVEGDFLGSVAEGFLAGKEDDFLFSPTTVWVSGRAEFVNQVSHVLVTISGQELTDSIDEAYTFQLIGASGDPLETLDVTCDVDTVYVNFPIWATAEVPLKVNLIPGGGLGENDVTCELSVDSIMVAGSREAVTALAAEGFINLATIDLASVRDGDELVFVIPLTDELTNISGIMEVKATITVKKEVVTQTFTATRIQYINKPEEWDVEIVTKEMSMDVRGTQELIDGLSEENIRVVADLQNITQAAGQYTVPVSIYLDSAGSSTEIGVMNANYSVVVALTLGGTD